MGEVANRWVLKYEKIIEGALGCADHEKKNRCDRKSCLEPEKSKLDIRGLLKYEKIIEGALGCADHEKNIGATESHVLSEKSQNEKSSQWIRSPSSETSRKGPNPFKVLNFQPPHPFIMPPSAVRRQLVGAHIYMWLCMYVCVYGLYAYPAEPPGHFEIQKNSRVTAMTRA